MLEKLLEKMMRIVIENAGAQRGLLVLEQNGQWHIQARVDVEQETAEILGGIPLETSGGRSATPLLSVSIVNFVIRTRDSLVLNDATREGSFTRAAYIAKNLTPSIPCAQTNQPLR